MYVLSNSTIISEFEIESQKSRNKLQVSITLDCYYNCVKFLQLVVFMEPRLLPVVSEEPICVGGERKMKLVKVDPGLTVSF